MLGSAGCTTEVAHNAADRCKQSQLSLDQGKVAHTDHQVTGVLKLSVGTVFWTSPGGQTYRTRPGSRLLFPSLCEPTAAVTISTRRHENPNSGLTMPRRGSTRGQDRQRRIDAERALNVADADDAAASAIPPF